MRKLFKPRHAIPVAQNAFIDNGSITDTEKMEALLQA